MFIYELKKILQTKGIKISIIIIVLCMILNGISNTGVLNCLRDDVLFDMNEYKETAKTYIYIEKLFHELSDTEYSEQEYINMCKEDASLYDGSQPLYADKKGKYGPAQKYDAFIYGTTLAQMYYLGMFKANILNVIANAKQIRENNKYLGEYSDPYKDKETTMMIEAYSNVSESTRLRLCYAVTAYWYAFTESEGSNRFNTQLLLFFICCIFSVYFTSEYESRMNQMTFVTFRGRQSTFAVKNMVVLLLSFIITLLSCIINAIILTIHYGGMNDALSQPIQLIFHNEAFAELCPFAITFGQYVLLAFFMKFTAFYFASNIVIFMSVLFRRSILAISFSALFIIGLLQFTLYTSQDYLITTYETRSVALYNIFLWLRTYSPISLLWSREYVNSFDVINMFGFPVYRIIFILIFSWVLIAVLYIINSNLYCRRGDSHDFRFIGYLKKVWQKRGIA